MANKLTEHRGFTIEASYYMATGRFVPTVFVRKDRSSAVTEIQLTPPYPDGGPETEKEAFAAGFDHAKALIDGRVAGIDVSKL